MPAPPAKKPRKEKYFESDRAVANHIGATRAVIAAWRAECKTIMTNKDAVYEELWEIERESLPSSARPSLSRNVGLLSDMTKPFAGLICLCFPQTVPQVAQSFLQGWKGLATKRTQTEAQNTHTHTHTGTLQQHKPTLAQPCLKECLGLESDPIVAPTLKVLKSRIAALQLVTASDESSKTELSSYLAERKAGDEDKAPPIQKFMDLVTIAGFEATMETEFRKCTSSRELLDVKRALKNSSAAISDLISVCKSLLKDIDKSVRNSGKLKALEQKLTQNAEAASAASSAATAKKACWHVVWAV